MKKNIILSFLAILMGGMAFISCKKSKSDMPDNNGNNGPKETFLSAVYKNDLPVMKFHYNNTFKKLSRIDYYNLSGILTQFTEFEFDANGRITKEKDGEGQMLTGSYSDYFYDAGNKATEFRLHDTSGKHVTTIKLHYGGLNNSQVVLQEVFDGDGNPLWYKEYAYVGNQPSVARTYVYQAGSPKLSDNLEAEMISDPVLLENARRVRQVIPLYLLSHNPILLLSAQQVKYKAFNLATGEVIKDIIYTTASQQKNNDGFLQNQVATTISEIPASAPKQDNMRYEYVQL
jgi:hypothetical protein